MTCWGGQIADDAYQIYLELCKAKALRYLDKVAIHPKNASQFGYWCTYKNLDGANIGGTKLQAGYWFEAAAKAVAWGCQTFAADDVDPLLITVGSSTVSQHDLRRLGITDFEQFLKTVHPTHVT